MGRNEPFPVCPFGSACVTCPSLAASFILPPYLGQLMPESQEFQSQGEAEPVGLGLKDPLTLNPETSGQIIWVDDLCQVRACAPGLVGEACV